MMHSLKEKIFSGEKHTDAEYDVAHSHFTQLHDSLVRLKAAAQNYSNSLYSSLFNSNSASVEFASILADPLTESGYEDLSRQMQTAHVSLSSERQSALTARMSESVLVPLDKLILQLLELNTKVTKRTELHTNLEYYLGKTATLLKEREERGAKGKPDSASQKDKLDRNQHKLDTVRSEYSTFAQPLIVEMITVWQTRAVALGPILAAFASVEKEFVQVYGAAVDSVHPEQIGAAPVSAAAIALQQRQAAFPPVTGVTTTATTTHTVTPVLASGIAASAAPAPAPVAVVNSGAAINPFAGNTPIADTTTQLRQTSIDSNSGANPFGEINEPLSTSNAVSASSLPAAAAAHATAAAAPTTTTTTTTASNPFDLQPAGHQEGAAFSGSTTTYTTSSTNSIGGVPALANTSASSKLEHENKQQAAASYEADHKTANIIGV